LQRRKTAHDRPRVEDQHPIDRAERAPGQRRAELDDVADQTGILAEGQVAQRRRPLPVHRHHAMASILDQRDRAEIEGAAHLPCLRDGSLRRLLRRGGLVQLLQRPEESRLLLFLPPDRAEQPLRLDRAGDFARERLQDALLLRREHRRPVRNQPSHQPAATAATPARRCRSAASGPSAETATSRSSRARASASATRLRTASPSARRAAASRAPSSAWYSAAKRMANEACAAICGQGTVSAASSATSAASSGMAERNGRASTYAAASRYMSGCRGGASCVSASTASAQTKPSSSAYQGLRRVESPQRASAPRTAAASNAHGAGCALENAPQSSRTHTAPAAVGNAARAAQLRALPVRGGIGHSNLKRTSSCRTNPSCSRAAFSSAQS